jgi:hypothetical protein
MNRDRKQRAAIRELAGRRVEAVWTCLGVLRPDIPFPERKTMAEKVLALSRGEWPPPAKKIEINPAQVQEMVWRNSQCVNRYCSMLLFSREMAEELNEFFNPEDED